MRDELEREVSALRSMVSTLSSVCEKLIQELPDGERKLAAQESLLRGRKSWHEWRTKRFDREVEDAEFVLRKAFNIGMERDRYWPIVEHLDGLEKKAREEAGTPAPPPIKEPR
jgi:hypothetical protein